MNTAVTAGGKAPRKISEFYDNMTAEREANRKAYSDSRAILVRNAGGWGLDVCNTSEADETRRLFGTTLLPLPLTPQCSQEYAWDFARKTAIGREHGVVLDVALQWQQG